MRGNRRATHTNVAPLTAPKVQEQRAKAHRQLSPRTQRSFVSQPRAHPDRTPLPPRTQRSFTLGDDVVINTALVFTHSMKRRKRVKTRGDSTSSLHTLSRCFRRCSSLTRTELSSAEQSTFCSLSYFTDEDGAWTAPSQAKSRRDEIQGPFSRTSPKPLGVGCQEEAGKHRP